jgi:hypothetical protein
MAEPHICDANWDTADPQEEWVMLVNGGASRVVISGLEVTDETATQQNPHIYTIPVYTDGSPIQLIPGQRAYVVTGAGTSEWRDVGGIRSLVLFWGRAATVWNNSGDVVYLRRSNGEFVDWAVVGAPPRHPGH